MKTVRALVCYLLLSVLTTIPAALAQEKNPQLLMKTTMGDMTIELYPKEAPLTTKNFLMYSKSGYFNGTIFHRVVNSAGLVVIQGGGFTKEMEKKKTRAPIKNEADNGLKNVEYTLSMARTSDPHSATSQFFINVKHNVHLDRESEFGDGYGYAVFGKVIKGQEVVNKIAKVKTGFRDVPVEPVIITAVDILDSKDE